MKIAYLIHQDVRGIHGGAEVYARHLAEAAVHQGHDVLLIARGDGHGERVHRADENGVAYAVLDAASLPKPGALIRLRETYDNPRAYELLKNIISAFAPDHLHVHHLLLTSARIVEWAVAHKIPVTGTLHDYWGFCHRVTWTDPQQNECPGPAGGLNCRHCGKEMYNRWPGRMLQPAHAAAFVHRNRLLRRAYCLMQAVYAPSRALLEAHRQQGFAEVNLQHRPYGLPSVEPCPRQRGAGPLVVGYVGRLVEEKGVETLIEAAKNGRGFMVRVYGKGVKGYKDYLRRLAAEAPVEFAGSFAHEKIDEVLRGIDVLAVPSRWRENLPLVVLEAAARGVPVLVSDLGGLRETVELCGASALPPGDVDAWETALSQLAAGEQALHQMARQVHYDFNIMDDVRIHLAGGKGE